MQGVAVQTLFTLRINQSVIVSSSVIQPSVTVDQEPVPETLAVRHNTPSYHAHTHIHTLIHALEQFSIADPHTWDKGTLKIPHRQ